MSLQPAFPETVMRRYGLPFSLTLSLIALSLVPVAGDEVLLPVAQPVKPRPGFVPAETPVNAALNDEDALKQAGLTPDDPKALIEYLKVRTLNDVDQNSIGDIIKKFGSDDFD